MVLKSSMESINSPATQAILDHLNPAQHAAVIHKLGPQLIVAGAGTGKTTVITRRIAYLVSTKTCSAREILALTFTDKAASEMESRVDILVPYGFNDSTICTFHAFGDQVLREQGLLLGMSPNYKILSDAEQLIFLREHLFELPLKKFLPLSDPTRHLQQIQDIISRAKDEVVEPETYLHYCASLEAQLTSDSQSVEQARIEKHKEVAQVYAHYQALLRQYALVDFGDLILLTLRLFKENPDTLHDYRQRYRFILVDEFQDTNTAQFELLRMLAGPEGNLCVVGDDDQSIYKFRGAAISNILQFTHYYPSATVQVLNENYRSPQSVLDAAYRLIRHNDPERLEVKLGLEKRLITHQGEGQPVKYQEFDSVSAEADWVAAEIEQRHKKGDINWRDFAILIRARRHVDPYLRALNMRGIPFQFPGNQGLYRQPEVKLCIAFLRTMADPWAPLPFYEMAASSVYSFPNNDLVQLTTISRRRHIPLYKLLPAILPEAELLTAEGKAAGKRLIEDVEHYLQLSQRLSTGQILYRFLTESGLLGQYTYANTMETDLAIRNIAKFFKLVQHYADMAKVDRAAHFVEHLDMLEEIGDEPILSDIDPELDALNVLTVHRSKGLEFRFVFMVGVATNRFPLQKRNQALQFPLELAKEDVPAEGNTFLSEERRLFYVAMTRAKETLVLTSAKDYGGARYYKTSRFVLEALDLPRINNKISTSALEKIKIFAPPQDIVPSSANLVDLDKVLTLSYYRIEDYLTCPLKYKYVHILKIPILPHHTILYGNAIHQAITEFYRMKKADQDVSLASIIDIFLKNWVSEGFISREHEEMRQKAGIKSLEVFYNKENITPYIPKYIEKTFSITLNKNRIIGRIDRVDFLPDGKVALIDFKTSEIKDQKEANQKAQESLQLKIYSLAWLKSEGRLPDWVELYFLEQGIIGQAIPNLDKISELEKVIENVANNIRQQKYEAKPDIWTCNFCAYRTICPEAKL